MPIKKKIDVVSIGHDLIDLKDEIVNDLSDDQKYGYRIVKAIRSGHMPPDLCSLGIGPVNHSRWLTTANRFLRMYCSEHGFTGKNLKNLKMIVEFIIGVYYPMWFHIKVKNSWIEGPRHVLYQIQLGNMQRKAVQEIVWPYVMSSAWNSHSESILQTLVCSNVEEERRFGVLKILEVRGENESGDMSVGSRKTPNVNKDATTIMNMISWDKKEVYEPVMTCNLSKQELVNILDNPMKVDYLPCHGQAIERVVKQVTKAAAAVYGEERRDGFIRASAAQRNLVPMRSSKQDLKKMAGEN